MITVHDNNLELSFSFFFAPAACPSSLLVVLTTHAISSTCFSSPLVCHCFTVKLLNSFIGVSTLVTFLSERHGYVRGVSFMCRMCLVTFRFSFIVRSNSSTGRQISFLFVLQRAPPPLFTSLPSLGFYRRRPGGIVKARRA